MPRKAPAEPAPESVLPLSPVVFSILLSLSSAEKHGYAIMKEAAETDGGSLRGCLFGLLAG